VANDQDRIPSYARGEIRVVPNPSLKPTPGIVGCSSKPLGLGAA
jgi:hypothetical protein